MFGQTTVSYDGIGIHPKFSAATTRTGIAVRIDPNYSAYPCVNTVTLTGSIRSFLAAVDGNGPPVDYGRRSPTGTGGRNCCETLRDPKQHTYQTAA